MEMKSKQFIFLILSVMLVVVLGLSACTPTAPAEEEAAPAEEEAAPAELEAAPAEEEAAPAEEVKEPVTVAFLYSEAAQDNGYDWMWDLGRQAIDEKFGDQVETLYVENVPFSEEAARIYEQLIVDGADMIFDTASMTDVRSEAAAAHPDVAFITTDVAIQDNVATVYYEDNRPLYITGAVAGLLSETGNIGYVTSFPYPYTNSGINALIIGARSVNPDATITVTYIGSWFDPTSARQAAEALVDNGADVLIGRVNIDTVMSVAEERGAWTFGLFHPMADFAPNSYATTFLIDTRDTLIAEVQNLLDGTWVGNQEFRYVPLESMSLDEWGVNVPQDVKDQAEALYDRMVNEDYSPYIGPFKDRDGNLVVAEGEALTEWDFFYGLEWLAEGVISSEE